MDLIKSAGDDDSTAVNSDSDKSDAQKSTIVTVHDSSEENTSTVIQEDEPCTTISISSNVVTANSDPPPDILDMNQSPANEQSIAVPAALPTESVALDLYHGAIISHPFSSEHEVSNWIDNCHRILLKFVTKSSTFVPTMHGGSFSPTVWQRLFSPTSSAATATGRTTNPHDNKWMKNNPTHMAGWLFSLLSVLVQDVTRINPRSSGNNHDQQNTTLQYKQIKMAMGIFSTLFECWSCLHWNWDQSDSKPHLDHHPDGVEGLDGKKKKENIFHIFTKSSVMFNRPTHSAHHVSFVTEDVLSMSWECAHQLIAHGCMDRLWFTIESVNIPVSSFHVLQELEQWIQSHIDLNCNPSDDIEFNSLESNKQSSIRFRHEGETILGHEDDLHLHVGEEEEEDGYSIVLPNSLVSSTTSRNESISSRNNPPRHFTKAISIVMDAIFPCHMSTEQLELTALKVVLTTGCRTLSSEAAGVDSTADTAVSEAMLHGRRVLLAMKVCYLIYLQTDSSSNRTTAQATLRQIVAAVFERLEDYNRIIVHGAREEKTATASDHGSRGTIDAHTPYSLGTMLNTNTDEAYLTSNRSGKKGSSSQQFSSAHHKDAFLIIRSLCMLTMKPVSSTPIVNTQITPSSRIRRSSSASIQEKVNAVSSTDTNAVVSESILQSKILGLELLLEVFTRTGTAALLSKIPALIFAVKHFLCYSLLSNCTSSDNTVVSLSLKIFVPLIQNCRHHLKTEIEAFVTQVFFVLLDSKNTLVDNKRRVVQLFEEICGDPHTLAEIFLNYDCDLSAVDLFQRIVNCLAKVAKYGLDERDMSSGSRGEKIRQDQRMLRLEGMKAMKEILASLNASLISSMQYKNAENPASSEEEPPTTFDVSSSSTSLNKGDVSSASSADVTTAAEKQSFVQIYDSKKKRKEEEAKVIIRFNQKPTAGIKYASQVGLVNGDDPSDIASFLIANNDVLDKTQIGEYLGRDPDIQDGFPLKVLHQYVTKLDFTGLSFDEAIRFYLSGFRLPGEAQKIDRIMEKFAERYTLQNPDVFPSADCAFILAFSIIMLNTDLHNPAIKEERRMTKDGFIRNNRGIADGKDLPDETLGSIFDRIKKNQITLKEDDEARVKLRVKTISSNHSSVSTSINPSNNEMDRAREYNYLKEREEIVRNTVTVLRRRQASRTAIEILAPTKGSEIFVRTQDSGLHDEYVSPMFDVTWGPALSVFSTVLESANGTSGSMLLAIASDEELEAAAENVAAALEICIDGIEIAIMVAGLCGSDTAKRAFVHALSNFTLLGTGRILEGQHIRCIEALLDLGLNNGELLGNTWEYIFHSLSEIARLRQVYEALARSKRTNESKVISIQERPHSDGDNHKGDNDEHSETINYVLSKAMDIDDEEEMDKHVIDEFNACAIFEHISVDMINGIYLRSASLSASSLKEFVFQLCRVSRIEIAGYGGHMGSQANDVDLSDVHYRQQHTLLTNTFRQGALNRYLNQPAMHSLERLIEVTHYNMESRPRLVFAEIWNIVSSHLTSTALHSNAAVAIYAVDSFRQLSLQFLYKEELGVFEFQRRFLKPFETIMLKSDSASVKEHLLKCLQQIILVHGYRSVCDANVLRETNNRKGGLRSAWKPILAIIGRGGNDNDDSVANLAFDMLLEQLQQFISSNMQTTSLGAANVEGIDRSLLWDDYFIDVVDALLMFIEGPRVDYSLKCIENLVTLSRYLSGDDAPSHINLKTRKNDRISILSEMDNELGLWWPLLLSLSKAIGDSRENVRSKSLDALFTVINDNFFKLSKYSSDVSPDSLSNKFGDLQTLQLIFRGVLTPILEYLETNSNSAYRDLLLPVPDGFERFRSTLPSTAEPSAPDGRQERINRLNLATFISTGDSRFERTFDNLMDGCISLILRSIQVFQTDEMVEDMLALIHHCLVSDSGLIAIRGLMVLRQFILSDLPTDKITNDTWETVCHLLATCLSVSGLRGTQNFDSLDTSTQSNEEFLRQEEELPDRRYIGSHAVAFIESLLLNESLSMNIDPHWYFFLVSELGRGVREWDQAASILDSHDPHSSASQCPHYAENALYGRRLLVRLLKNILVKPGLFPSIQIKRDDEIRSRHLVFLDECAFIIESYVAHENVAHEISKSMEVKFMAPLLIDLVNSIQALDDNQLSIISSIGEVLASSIQIDNRSVRSSVSRVLQRILKIRTQVPSIVVI